jgi:hypothetical protein
MSSIPPNPLSSIVQTHAAQQRASEARQKEANADRARSRDTSFSDKLHDVIENADRDSSVHSDAEGAGSQGRAFGEEEPADEACDPDTDSSGPNPSDGGLDIQA